LFQGPKRIVYQVSSLEEARRWYIGILGTEPVYDSPFGVIFLVGNGSLSLTPGGASLPDDNGRMSVYWEVEDVDAAYQRLIAAGARSHTEPRNLASIRTARVVDPFGNVLGLTGMELSANDQTVESQPSKTAAGVALCRALAVYDERPELKGPDALAELFLPEEATRPLREPAARAKVIAEVITARRYGYMIARTAFIDERFEAALCDGTPQIVFLGAGYDTRAHRYAHALGRTTVFELDVPTTQSCKREALQKANLPTPAQLRYVPINFKTGSLLDSLGEAGFQPHARTLFIWEGVTYYLTAEAIDATLRFVREHAPAGSSIAFDYMIAPLESVVTGEPFLFWLKKEALEPFLRQRGFEVLDHLDAREIERRYLTLGDGTVAEGSMPHFCFVHAAVQGPGQSHH
jgi:methyltransferase (TIGR00027 family)